jgi:hypothetical protein
MKKDDKDIQDAELIDVTEASDGSAVVELPESIPSPDVVSEKIEEDSDEADEEARQTELANGGTVDPDAEAIREAKRAKRRARKDYHKHVAVEKDRTLQFLERQNQELLERLAIVEKKTQGSEIARINKAIEDQEAKVLFAKSKMKEATETGNGEMLASAQDMWYEAKKQHEALDHLKRQSVSQPQRAPIQQVDPMIQRYATDWMSDNQWYDPNGRDPDSKIALTIDQGMAEDGWNPKTQEYWEELDNRLAKYLPHRYSGAVETSVNPSTRRPKSLVTSSGRESASSSGGKNSFTLKPEQVRAMKDAGMWDDPDKRMRMIRRYADDARKN